MSKQCDSKIPTTKSLSAVNNVFRFLVYLWGIVPLHLTIMVSLKIILSFAPGIQMLVTKKLVDLVGAIFSNKDIQIFLSYKFIGYQFILLVLSQFLMSIDKINKFQMQQKITYHVEQELARKTSEVPLSYYDDSNFYDLMLRASSGQSQRVVDILNGPLEMIQNTISIFTLVGILIHFHWTIAVLVILVSIPPLIVNMYISKMKYVQMEKTIPLLRKINYYINLLRGRDASKEIRLFRLNDYFIEKWKKVFWETSNIQLKTEFKVNSMQIALDFFSNLAVSCSLVIIIWVGRNNNLSIGGYVAVSQTFLTMKGLLSGLTTNVSSVYVNTLSLRDLISFLKLPVSSIIDNNSENNQSLNGSLLETGILVENLSFSYANGKTILDNISFSIKPGEKIAIVGLNGAGKTTLIKCLLGLYRSYEGCIFFSGVELKNIPSKVIFNHVSAVFQDYMKYECSVKENIGFGNISLLEDEDSIRVAAVKSNANTIIDKLDEGYDTMLGVTFSKGIELSGGQWQKIAISRAFLSSAELIVLDEPAAAMDPLSEAELYKNFSELTKGKTTIMISHRLNSCVYCDHILVLKNGIIVEQGNHSELIYNGGEYATMFHAQAKGFSGGDI